jgi:hypothetical protein
MVNAALLEEAIASTSSGGEGGGGANGSKENGKEEDRNGDDDAVARPLLERVLVQLAAAWEALRDAKADGRGSPFRLPTLGGGNGGN